MGLRWDLAPATFLLNPFKSSTCVSKRSNAPPDHGQRASWPRQLVFQHGVGCATEGPGSVAIMDHEEKATVGAKKHQFSPRYSGVNGVDDDERSSSCGSP